MIANSPSDNARTLSEAFVPFRIII